MATVRMRRLLCAAMAGALLVACASKPREPIPRYVLVLGATGQLGTEIVRPLVAQGYSVVAFVRPNSDRGRLGDLPVDYVVGDLTNAADVAAAIRRRQHFAIVSAVRVEDGDIHFYEKIMTPIVRLARETGVKQIIHHGAVGAGDNVQQFTQLGWDRVPGLLDRLKDQGIGEQLLKTSGVAYTIIRNSRLYPDGTPSTGKAALTEDTSVLTPMTRADLAKFTLQCLGAPACFNKTYHVRDDSLAWPPLKP
jgi:uncharacterized protein YbjT (DUF2867 family)